MNEEAILKGKKVTEKQAAKTKVKKQEIGSSEEIASETFLQENSATENSFKVAPVEAAEVKVVENEKMGKIKKHKTKIRTLCKLVKRDYQKKHFNEYSELVRDPKYVCRKCGRGAKEKQYLCHPMLIVVGAQLEEPENHFESDAV